MEFAKSKAVEPLVEFIKEKVCLHGVKKISPTPLFPARGDAVG